MNSSLRIGVQVPGGGFERRWIEALLRHNAEVVELDLYRVDALDQARRCDGVMWHFRHEPDDLQIALPLLHVLETELQIPVFPDLRTAWHFDNKAAQANLFKAHGIPTPRTWLFWKREEAIEWARRADYPVVFKLSAGAGSANVRLIRDFSEAKERIERMFSRSGEIQMVYHPPGAGRLERLFRELRGLGLRLMSAPAYIFLKRYPPLPRRLWMPAKNYVLFQEFLPGNAFDTRVTVIGNRAFAFRRFNRQGDFKASGSGKVDVNPDAIDERCLQLAFEAADRLSMQSMACDILFRPSSKEPVLSEISYGYVDHVVEQCPGHWDRDLLWHEGRMWPQEAHVEDFIDLVRAAHAR